MSFPRRPGAPSAVHAAKHELGFPRGLWQARRGEVRRDKYESETDPVPAKSAFRPTGLHAISCHDLLRVAAKAVRIGVQWEYAIPPASPARHLLRRDAASREDRAYGACWSRGR